jgi:hypothetical protein
MENLVFSLPMVATTQITMSAGNDAMVATPSAKWILSLIASHPVSGRRIANLFLDVRHAGFVQSDRALDQAL